MNETRLPLILIVDDLFGRTLPDGRNEDRATLCGHYLLRDITGDDIRTGREQKIAKPVAEAKFHRGQTPQCSTIGDVVDNDLPGIVEAVREGWCHNDHQKPSWSLVLLDLCFYTGAVTASSNRRAKGMPEGRETDDDPRYYFGLHVLQHLHEEFPDLPIVILSSKPRTEVSREFSYYGAQAFLERDDEQSPQRLHEYIWRHGLIPDTTGEIVGRSIPLLRALRSARRASISRQNIVVRGERGTGKELLAKYIHRVGILDKHRPLVTVDAGALTPELYASALFGHKRGAFTGADQPKRGSIVEANGGDLFLDEIGNMPGEVQKALLRVLEYRQVAPLGGSISDMTNVDVRFLSATNADLEAMASAGSFRADLFDRLKEGGILLLPPLRERPEDLKALAERFVREAEAAHPSALKRQIEPEAFEVMLKYPWPGNIRELRGCLHRAVANHPDVEHLFPFHLSISDRSSSEDRVRVTPTHFHTSPRKPVTLRDLAQMLESFPTNELQPTDFAGQLEELQNSWARVIAGLLRTSIKATRRATARHPEGEVYILPALRLLTGDADLKAWQAYDWIKRIFELSPKVREELCSSDQLLSDVFLKARRSRNRPSPLREAMKEER